MFQISFGRGLLLVACALFPVALSAQSRDDVSSRHQDAVSVHPPTATTPVVPHGAPPAFPNEGWASRTPMAAGRWAHAMASFSTGVFPANESYVYVIGGGDAAFTNTALLSRYDVDGDVWTDLSPMPTARMQIGAARVGDRIFVPGGYLGSFSPVNTMSIYDIPTDTWSTGAVMPQATGDYAIGVYANRYVYVIGGYSGSVDLDLVQVYDTVDDTWQAATPKIGAATAGLRGGIVGDRIVVVGGFSQALAATQSTTVVGTIDPNDPLLINWTAAAAYPGGPAGRLGAGVPVAAGPAVGSDLANTVLFTAGDPDGAGTAVLSGTWLYDFNDDAWKAGPAKPTGVSNIVNLAGVASDGKMHMVSTGGYNGSAVVAVNEWLTFGDEPVPDLEISLTADPVVVVPGASIAYTVAYSASGEGSTVANVIAIVPAGTAFDPGNSAPAWICVPDNSAGSSCSANVGTLVSGDAGSLVFSVESLYPVPMGVTEILFDVGIAGVYPETNEGNNSAMIAVPFAAGSVAVDPTTGLITDEGGGIATYDVVLGVPPVVDVTLEFVSTDPSEGTPSPSQLVFTPANWNIAQTVSVAGIGDLDQDGDIAYSVTGAVAASAANYDGVTVPSVSLTNEDSPPPTVTSVSSVRDTGDGVLDAGETTSRSITQLIVDFNAALGTSAFDTASYRLIDAGPNGLVDSMSCADLPSDDDVEIAVDTVTYMTVPSRAVLEVGAGFALPRGGYRLFACDVLRDAVGVSLDGDGDGLPGGDFVRDFVIDATNRVGNPNFDTGLGAWIPVSGMVGIGWGTGDGDGAASSGSARIDTANGAKQEHYMLQCVDAPLLGGASAVTRVVSGTPGFPEVTVSVEYYAGPACSGEVVATAIAAEPTAGDSGGAWVPMVARADHRPDAASSRVVMQVSAGDAAAYTVELDHVASINGIPIFVDGFEATDIE